MHTFNDLRYGRPSEVMAILDHDVVSVDEVAAALTNALGRIQHIEKNIQKGAEAYVDALDALERALPLVMAHFAETTEGAMTILVMREALSKGGRHV